MTAALPRFAGTYVALVTPFLADGAFDEPSYKRLVEYVIEGGVTGVVPCGTTGEKSTLTTEEHQRVIECTIALVAGRAKVIAGAGSNDTAQAIVMTSFAKRAGADAALSTAPYYNKPTQEGLFRHYSAIAEKADFPIIIYNVPGRTSVNVAVETIARLMSDPRVAGVKDAAGPVETTMELVRAARSLRGEGKADFTILSGDDSLTFPKIAIGAHGVISVNANEVPREMSAMVRAALAGDYDKALEIHYRIYDIMTGNFIETNPGPVKYALWRMGVIARETLRLPLCEMNAPNKQKMDKILAELNLIR